MKTKLHWGILGLGKIAHKFVQDLLLVDSAILQAVASRSINKAEQFQGEYNANTAYGSYEELLSDPNVEIIYIATPHNLHKDWTIKAMKAGKHVLCEKPAGVNQKEVQEMVSIARKENVFFMEALWTRFNPVIREVYGLIQQNTIGRIRSISADFSFPADFSDESRLFSPHLAGGATLDIGIYPLFLSYLILGQPKNLLAKSIMYHTGVDLQTSVLCQYEGAFANLYFGLNSESDMIASIYGEKGIIHIHGRWHESAGYTLIHDDDKKTFSYDLIGRGYSYQIHECHEMISANKIESTLWKHQDSLNLIRLCDEVRKQIGLEYPFEEK